MASLPLSPLKAWELGMGGTEEGAKMPPSGLGWGYPLALLALHSLVPLGRQVSQQVSLP